MKRLVSVLCTVVALAAAPSLAAAQATGTAPSAIPTTPAHPPAGQPLPGQPAPGQAAPGQAAPQKKQLTKQQMKMKDCSKEAKAKGLKGDPRSTFMKKCLSED
jgi:hypothetical protein